VRVLPENNTRQGFFERLDLETVVTALPAYLRDFTRFAYLTGWRKGEIISLKWTDVDRDAGTIRLRPEAAKTGLHQHGHGEAMLARQVGEGVGLRARYPGRDWPALGRALPRGPLGLTLGVCPHGDYL
jgi:integrase